MLKNLPLLLFRWAPLYWLFYYVTWKCIITATKELHLRTCFSSSRWQSISFIDQDHVSQTVLWSSSRKKKSIQQYDCKTTDLFLIFWDNEMIIFSHLGEVYKMPFNNFIMWQWLISLCLLLQSLLLAAASSPINTGVCWWWFADMNSVAVCQIRSEEPGPPN